MRPNLTLGSASSQPCRDAARLVTCMRSLVRVGVGAVVAPRDCSPRWRWRVERVALSLTHEVDEETTRAFVAGRRGGGRCRSGRGRARVCGGRFGEIERARGRRRRRPGPDGRGRGKEAGRTCVGCVVVHDGPTGSGRDDEYEQATSSPRSPRHRRCPAPRGPHHGPSSAGGRAVAPLGRGRA